MRVLITVAYNYGTQYEPDIIISARQEIPDKNGTTGGHVSNASNDAYIWSAVGIGLVPSLPPIPDRHHESDGRDGILTLKMPATLGHMVFRVMLWTFMRSRS